MKALLLAAGFGSRLGELTRSTPKPLLNVGQSSLFDFCLRELELAGVTDVIVNTHHLASRFEDHLKTHNLKLRVELSYEEALLGTAGTLRKHFDYLATEDFVVMHADNYFEDSLGRFVKAHKLRTVGKYGSLGAFETDDPTNCGVLVLNADNTINEFYEKVSNPPTNLANSAIYVFTPLIREHLFKLRDGENDISKHLIPKIMSGLRAHKFEGLFVDIGTPAGLKLAIDYEVLLRRSSTD
jgi:mannose-1-phosphate guanylyltransferase